MTIAASTTATNAIEVMLELGWATLTCDDPVGTVCDRSNINTILLVLSGSKA